MRAGAIRWLLTQYDKLAFGWWRFRFTTAYRCWGEAEQVRRLASAPARYYPAILKTMGAGVGREVTFKPGLLFDNLAGGMTHLTIADRAYIGPGVFFDLASSITIGTEAVLSPQVRLLTHGDVGSRWLARWIQRREGPVVLKKGCWIGTGAIILPGVTIGEGAVIGAGAVVTSDVGDYTVMAGVPARVLRKLDETQGASG
jgi:acetyltransferase-like isoleucine patch superfamily enzyme